MGELVPSMSVFIRNRWPSGETMYCCALLVWTAPPIGFFADGKLRRIDIDGGSVQALASAVAGQGGAWNRDGTILFGTNFVSRLFRISATGGEPVAVTRLDGQQLGHNFPHFLPDGRHFLYYVRGNVETQNKHTTDWSNESSSRFEICVQPFSFPEDKPSGKWQISTNGGAQVRWRRDGKEYPRGRRGPN